tara:strand:+ start:6305 stop:7012 length:708 start_codon:yes stop_codon:yes gene_type:complete
MAVDVNAVYRTVLLIINKEQRGYLTPDEFNKIATQVQLEIFNQYFEDLNQLLRVPGNDSEYSDRVRNLEEKIAVFETSGTCTYGGGVFSIPTPTAPIEFYKLGTVIYKSEKEITLVKPNELLELNLSPITKPSTYFPVYIYQGYNIVVYPLSITSDVSCTYVKKPLDPKWDFTTSAPSYQYTYNSAGSQDFELHITEQTDIIIRILMYTGIVIKDPLIIQSAAQQAQMESINSKM